MTQSKLSLYLGEIFRANPRSAVAPTQPASVERSRSTPSRLAFGGSYLSEIDVEEAHRIGSESLSEKLVAMHLR